MGMITRVRGRLRSLHTINKLDPEVRDEKIAETGKSLFFSGFVKFLQSFYLPFILKNRNKKQVIRLFFKDLYELLLILCYLYANLKIKTIIFRFEKSLSTHVFLNTFFQSKIAKTSENINLNIERIKI